MGPGHLYTMFVTLVVWVGIFAYLRRMERKVNDLEQDPQS
jgi:CcmD family protein